MSDAEELSRLRAVEAAVEAEVTEPGAVTKAELRAALAATPVPVPAADQFPPTFEERF